MKTSIRRAISSLLVSAIWISSLSHAAVPTAVTYTPTNPIPPNVISTPARPLIMLNMSKDHQLFYRAYNEYSDYNGDGQPDGTYLHTVRYSGYFDTTKCYTYSNANGRFAPSASVSSSNTCSSAWHGNFLNWATMTRMDVLRKVLYGGTRSTDTGTSTVLERASLPMDAHSFAKYYVNAPTPTADRPNISSITPFGVTELTFCNTTIGSNSNTFFSHTNTNPPLLRATSGNYSLWNAHERRQCRWADETWSSSGSGNGNNPAVSGIQASANYPSRTTALAGGNNGDFIVRVEACVTGQLGSERCRTYPSGSAKPIGLLQEYGETDLAEFGLMTGSFSSNTAGGVLRKNASTFSNEVNVATNGTFVSGVNGIVSTLDRLKVFGYAYGDGVYGNATDGNCTFQLTSLSGSQCASWGNPIGEMFIETLRYLAGLTPATSYGGGADAKGGQFSPALTVSAWTDPLGTNANPVFGAPQCRPIDVVNFNASVTSYDRETTTPFGDLPGAPTIAPYVNAVGDGEGITNTRRFIGRTATPSTTDGSCTAKTIGNLADADGICPVAPDYRGSYTLAGAAYWANTHAIRTVPATLTGNDALRAYRVRTYSVALAPGVPRIEVRTSGANPLRAIIQPAYRLQVGGGVGAGTLVDFRVISQTATSGSYLVVWEDSAQGGDYDQDVNGILSWSVSGSTLTVSTRVITQSTSNPQGFGYTISGTNRDGVHFHSGILGFDFTDPTNVPVTPNTNSNASGGCNDCEAGQPATVATYTVTGAAGQALEDPLWYAAKWGGFRDAQGVPAAAPNTAALWDAQNNQTGLAGSDGVPDNYFEVFNPDQLEQALRRVFTSAVVASNASPAISSAQLTQGGFKYVASFDATRRIGNVQAFGLTANGDFATGQSWDVGRQLTDATPASRQIITNDQTTGFSFDWASISSSSRANYRALMTTGATNTIDDARAQLVTRFIRGDRSVEGTANNIRVRDPLTATTQQIIMGPVVNASPWLQDRPSARFLNSANPGYSAFANSAASRNRTRVLWTAADDGMLHAFNADSGAPIMSYLPEGLVPRLNELVTDSTIRAYVDGSPFTADVDINAGVSTTADWRTYAFGSLGRGGKAVFALDATDVGVLAAAASGTNPASIFRWQFTANDDSDLGYTLSDVDLEPGTNQPKPIVKLQNGQFAMVFGNGTNSTNGRAVLFILPIRGPAANGSWTGQYYKITLDPNGTGGNGLSTPTMIDTNNDGRVDTVYAGDKLGNLWKIDLSSATPSNWGSAYLAAGVPTPLYIALDGTGTTRLPITGAPQFSFPRFGGTIVSFATGLSVQSGDFPQTTRAQRVFGIWDRPDFATGGRALPRGTNTLVPRTLSRTSTGQVAITGAANIDYLNTNAATARDGWYFQLPGSPTSSEMVLSNLGISGGNLAITSVRSPSTNQCSGTPQGSFYLFDPVVGYATNNTLGTVDVAANGVYVAVMGIDIADQKVRVVSDATQRTTPPPNGSTGPGTPVCPDGTAALRVVGQGTDLSLCFRQSSARFQWREIPGLRTN